MERGETQAETEAHVNCAKKVMMVLEMLALPEGGNVASQAKEEAAGGLSSCPADKLCLPGAGGLWPRLCSQGFMHRSSRWALDTAFLGTESPP